MVRKSELFMLAVQEFYLNGVQELDLQLGKWRASPLYIAFWHGFILLPHLVPRADSTSQGLAAWLPRMNGVISSSTILRHADNFTSRSAKA